MQRLIHCFTRRNPDGTVNGINQLMNKRRLNEWPQLLLVISVSNVQLHFLKIRNLWRTLDWSPIFPIGTVFIFSQNIETGVFTWLMNSSVNGCSYSWLHWIHSSGVPRLNEWRTSAACFLVLLTQPRWGTRWHLESGCCNGRSGSWNLRLPFSIRPPCLSLLDLRGPNGTREWKITS